MHLRPSSTSRRAVRRAVLRPCVAVATDGYRLLGQRVLDLSPRGMLVTCGQQVEPGDEVFVTFQAPGDGLWMNAEAEVTRIVRGSRFSDAGPCVGLRFRDMEGSRRGELLSRLAGIPPTIPRRPLRFSSSSRGGLSVSAIPLVRIRRVMRTVPRGVWSVYN
jgi:hypothetical protein